MRNSPSRGGAGLGPLSLFVSLVLSASGLILHRQHGRCCPRHSSSTSARYVGRVTSYIRGVKDIVSCMEASAMSKVFSPGGGAQDGKQRRRVLLLELQDCACCTVPDGTRRGDKVALGM